jgi:ubiquinone/menaquinone biosynthesis C-methylase UbiE
MINAELYSKQNHLQIRDAEEIIQKFNEIVPSSQESLTLMDIGSGCGEVLVNVVIRKMKFNLKEAFGIDICQEMVEHSKKKYENRFLKFFCIDLFNDELFLSGRMELKPGSIDIVTSFYCLHWLKDLK